MLDLDNDMTAYFTVLWSSVTVVFCQRPPFHAAQLTFQNVPSYWFSSPNASVVCQNLFLLEQPKDDLFGSHFTNSEFFSA